MPEPAPPSGTATAGAPAVAVRMTGVSKSFGAVQALVDVDLEVRAGEVHALVGENGAGKSTLLKILQGVHTPTAGQVEVLGATVDTFAPAVARDLGVAMIFQEMSLVPTMTVAQNVYLGHEPQTGRLIDDRALRRDAAALFSRLGVDVDPSTTVDRLSTGEQQLTEIAKALSHDARVLILDEPTTALTATETDLLFGIVEQLRDDGVAIVYVSHRMNEIMQVADRVTVLRDGHHITTQPASDLGIDGIIEQMIGRSVTAFTLDEREVPDQPPLLEVDDLCVDPLPTGVDLRIRPGEIVGLAGLMGSGRSELARALCGLQPITSGTVRVRGETVRLEGADAALAAGLALVPEDRRREGLVFGHSVAANATLASLNRVSEHGIVRPDRVREITDGVIDRLRVKTPSGRTRVDDLSGGNQQKVVIGKAMASEPDVLVLDEPTAGVDVGSKAEILELVRGFAAEGRAVLVISSELPELIALSHRIVVLQNGRVANEVTRDELRTAAAAAGANEGRIRLAEQRLQRAIQPTDQPEEATEDRSEGDVR